MNNWLKIGFNYLKGYTYIEWYKDKNGKNISVKKQGKYKKSRLNGKLVEYYQDGSIQCESYWNGGTMVYLKEYDQNGRIVKDYKDGN